MRTALLTALSVCVGISLFATAPARALSGYAAHAADGRGWVFTSDSGQHLRVTPYGDHMVRIQVREAGEPFGPDDRYEMVATHAWTGLLAATDAGDVVRLAPTGSSASPAIEVTKKPLGIRLVDAAGTVFETKDLSNGSRPIALLVDGAVAAGSVSLPRTTSWDAWSTVSVDVPLHAGKNALRLTSTSASGPNIDSITVSGTKYEAEAAQLSGAVAATDHGGFTGSGFADFTGAAGSYLEWQVDAPSAGTYPVVVRYANVSKITASFAPHANEHFAGLGHGAYGRVAHLDLRGSVQTRSRVNQAPLFVPFWMSSRGYGVFVDDTYPLTASFLDTDYGVSVDGGQLDFYVIMGPALPDVLDHYTELTGRPRLPPISAFGLGLSDKATNTGPDGQGDLVSNETWWKDKILRMREIGVPFDIVIHDNSWRGAKTGAWSWDKTRYPDPAEYAAWSKANGVVNMLDFNRADVTYSKGWQPSFKLPGTIEGGERGGWPDFTRADVRAWFWGLLRDETFDPKLGYPGDFLWLDEPDEDVAPTGPLGNGRTWDEMGAYYFFLMAKAVGEGWDRDLAGAKRPFLMARGMTAGAQRWSSLWSGDIEASYDEMKQQIRGMLAAGVSGFPYWAHDAGGFYPQEGPSLSMYRRWALAMGSFSPVWKPHGPGFRFPWDKYAPAEGDARTYAMQRMELLPYLYSIAHAAHDHGTPMARPLFFSYPEHDEAWSNDLSYLWGADLFVAPATSDNASFDTWIPPGHWYRLADDAPIDGPTSTTVASEPMPVYVRAGAIVPRARPMQSTAGWDHRVLIVDVYAGADGAFDLVEDDGISEHYAAGDERVTPLRSKDVSRVLEIGPATGTFGGANDARAYEVRFHGLAAPIALAVDGVPANASWDAAKKILSVTTSKRPASALVVIGPPPGPGGEPAAPSSPGEMAATKDASGGCGCKSAPGGAPLAALSVSATVLAALLRRRRRASRAHGEGRARRRRLNPSAKIDG